MRDFGAPRNAGFWGEEVVSIVCDGLHPRGARKPVVRSVSAVQGRKAARHQGWRVGVKDPSGGKPRDYCPEHEIRHATAANTEGSE